MSSDGPPGWVPGNQMLEEADFDDSMLDNLPVPDTYSLESESAVPIPTSSVTPASTTPALPSRGRKSAQPQPGPPPADPAPKRKRGRPSTKNTPIEPKSAPIPRPKRSLTSVPPPDPIQPLTPVQYPCLASMLPDTYNNIITQLTTLQFASYNPYNQPHELFSDSDLPHSYNARMSFSDDCIPLTAHAYWYFVQTVAPDDQNFPFINRGYAAELLMDPPDVTAHQIDDIESADIGSDDVERKHEDIQTNEKRMRYFLGTKDITDSPILLKLYTRHHLTVPNDHADGASGEIQAIFCDDTGEIPVLFSADEPYPPVGSIVYFCGKYDDIRNGDPSKYMTIIQREQLEHDLYTPLFQTVSTRPELPLVKPWGTHHDIVNYLVLLYYEQSTHYPDQQSSLPPPLSFIQQPQGGSRKSRRLGDNDVEHHSFYLFNPTHLPPHLRFLCNTALSAESKFIAYISILLANHRRRAAQFFTMHCLHAPTVLRQRFELNLITPQTPLFYIENPFFTIPITQFLATRELHCVRRIYSTGVSSPHSSHPNLSKLTIQPQASKPCTKRASLRVKNDISDSESTDNSELEPFPQESPKKSDLNKSNNHNADYNDSDHENKSDHDYDPYKLQALYAIIYRQHAVSHHIFSSYARVLHHPRPCRTCPLYANCSVISVTDGTIIDGKHPLVISLHCNYGIPAPNIDAIIDITYRADIDPSSLSLDFRMVACAPVCDDLLTFENRTITVEFKLEPPLPPPRPFYIPLSGQNINVPSFHTETPKNQQNDDMKIDLDTLQDRLDGSGGKNNDSDGPSSPIVDQFITVSGDLDSSDHDDNSASPRCNHVSSDSDSEFTSKDLKLVKKTLKSSKSGNNNREGSSDEDTTQNKPQTGLMTLVPHPTRQLAMIKHHDFIIQHINASGSFLITFTTPNALRFAALQEQYRSHRSTHLAAIHHYSHSLGASQDVLSRFLLSFLPDHFFTTLTLALSHQYPILTTMLQLEIGDNADIPLYIPPILPPAPVLPPPSSSPADHIPFFFQNVLRYSSIQSHANNIEVKRDSFFPNRVAPSHPPQPTSAPAHLRNRKKIVSNTNNNNNNNTNNNNNNNNHNNDDNHVDDADLGDTEPNGPNKRQRLNITQNYDEENQLTALDNIKIQNNNNTSDNLRIIKKPLNTTTNTIISEVPIVPSTRLPKSMVKFKECFEQFQSIIKQKDEEYAQLQSRYNTMVGHIGTIIDGTLGYIQTYGSSLMYDSPPQATNIVKDIENVESIPNKIQTNSNNVENKPQLSESSLLMINSTEQLQNDDASHNPYIQQIINSLRTIISSEVLLLPLTENSCIPEQHSNTLFVSKLHLCEQLTRQIASLQLLTRPLRSALPPIPIESESYYQTTITQLHKLALQLSQNNQLLIHSLHQRPFQEDSVLDLSKHSSTTALTPSTSTSITSPQDSPSTRATRVPSTAPDLLRVEQLSSQNDMLLSVLQSYGFCNGITAPLDRDLVEIMLDHSCSIAQSNGQVPQQPTLHLASLPQLVSQHNKIVERYTLIKANTQRTEMVTKVNDAVESSTAVAIAAAAVQGMERLAHDHNTNQLQQLQQQQQEQLQFCNIPPSTGAKSSVFINIPLQTGAKSATTLATSAEYPVHLPQPQQHPPIIPQYPTTPDHQPHPIPTSAFPSVLVEMLGFGQKPQNITTPRPSSPRLRMGVTPSHSGLQAGMTTTPSSTMIHPSLHPPKMQYGISLSMVDELGGLTSGLRQTDDDILGHTKTMMVSRGGSINFLQDSSQFDQTNFTRPPTLRSSGLDQVFPREKVLSSNYANIDLNNQLVFDKFKSNTQQAPGSTSPLMRD